MQTIPAAMIWEMLWRGRWSLIAAVLGANALPVVLLAALYREGGINSLDSIMIHIHFVLVQLNTVIFGFAVVAAQGNPKRLFTFPIANSTIVAWHLLPAMVLVALESAASTAALNAIFPIDWPIWGPALLLAVAVAAVQAALWLAEKSAWIVQAMTLVGAVLGIWFKSRYGEPFSQPDRYWREVTAGEVATILAFALVAYWIACAAVARNRCGQPPVSLGVVAWWTRWMRPLSPRQDRPFRSPAHAQRWFEWQQKGWVMPVSVLFGMVAGGAGWLMFSRDPQELLRGLVAGGAILSAVGPLGGIVLGNSGPRDGNYQISSFLATRPMTSTDMAGTILKTAARSTLLAWGIWAAGFLTLYLILLAANDLPERIVPEEIGWLYAPATLLGPWIFAASGASIGLTGRTRYFTKLLCGLLSACVGMMLISKFALAPSAQARLGYGAMMAGGAMGLAGTIWVFAAAHQRELIRWRTTLAAASVWAALITCIALRWFQIPGAPLSLCLFFIGLSSFAVAPVAAAPLALTWNRHR